MNQLEASNSAQDEVEVGVWPNVDSFIPKSDAVIENEIEMAIGYGLELPDGMEKKEFVQIMTQREKAEEWKQEHAEKWAECMDHAKKLLIIRRAIAANLQRALEDPSSFGVEVDWRPTQRECIEALIWCLRHGYHRLPIQIPTGGGKSHILGVVARCTHDAYEALGIDAEMILLDPFENLARQLGAEGVDPLSGEVKVGDVRKWLLPVMSDNQMRIVAGDSKKAAEEKAKSNAKFTAEVFTGFTRRRIEEIHSEKPVSLTLPDEGHSVTERFRALHNTHIPTAHSVGCSATIYGPNRNPFHFFERIRKPHHRGRGIDDIPWTDQLAFHMDRTTMVNRRELKPLRLFRKPVDIDLSQVNKTSTGGFKDDDVWRVFSRNLPSLKEFIRDVMEEDNAALRSASSVPIAERTSAAFVKFVDLAEELAAFCNDEIDGMRAEWVSGAHTQDEFDAIQRRLASGETNMLFGCRKPGIGLDNPAINAVWNLWPHPKLWLLEQEIGRGMRFNPLRPDDDCLCIQPGYKMGQHKLATPSQLFGQFEGFNGGLVAPGEMRDLESKILHLLHEGRDMLEVHAALTPKEMDLAEELGWTFWSNPESKGGWMDMDERVLPITFAPGEIQHWKQLNPDVPDDDEQYIPVLLDMVADRGFPTKIDALANTSGFKSTTFGSFGKPRAIYRKLFHNDDKTVKFTFGQQAVLDLIDRVFGSTAQEDEPMFLEILERCDLDDRQRLIFEGERLLEEACTQGKLAPFTTVSSFVTVLTRRNANSGYGIKRMMSVANVLLPVSVEQMRTEVLEYVAEEAGVYNREQLLREKPGKVLYLFFPQIQSIHEQTVGTPIPEHLLKSYGRQEAFDYIAAALYPDGVDNVQDKEAAKERRRKRLLSQCPIGEIVDRESLLAFYNGDRDQVSRIEDYYYYVFDRYMHHDYENAKFRLADLLYPLSEQDRMQLHRDVVSETAGVCTRGGFFNLDPEEMNEMEWGEFGHAVSWYGVFSQTYQSKSDYRKADFERFMQHCIGNRLFPVSEQEQLQELQSVLAQKGYVAPEDIEEGDLDEFLEEDFGMFGTGLEMFKLVAPYRSRFLEKNSWGPRTSWGPNMLVEIRERAWPRPYEERVAEFREIFAQNGITTEQQLRKKTGKGMDALKWGRYKDQYAAARSFFNWSLVDGYRYDCSEDFADAIFAASDEHQLHEAA